VAFTCFAACIFAAGFAYYHAQIKNIRRESIKLLSAISELKTMRIANWRQEQIQDALLLANDPYLVTNLHDALPAMENENFNVKILSFLRIAQKVHGYRNIIILDLNGSHQFSSIVANAPSRIRQS
jgi:hypothetical protein